MRGVLLRYPEPGWSAQVYSDVFPGAHVLVFGRNRHALEAEDAGFTVRDAIEVIGPTRHRVWLLRKPLAEKNVIGQVLKTGTGALWIDGCRVVTTESLNGGTYSPGIKGRLPGDPRQGAAAGMFSGEGGRLPGQFIQPRGRWPSNLLLVHAPGCQRAGTRRVKNVGGATSGETALGQGSGWNAHENRLTGIARQRGEDGLETIDAWACVPGCPVAALDVQSGVRPSTLTGRAEGPSENPAQARPEALWGSGLKGGVGQVYADTGGASRFFPQFADETELDAWLLSLILGHQQ